MMSVFDVILLVGFGELSALLLVIGGCVIHMRYIDRKLMKPQPKQMTQAQQGAVK